MKIKFCNLTGKTITLLILLLSFQKLIFAQYYDGEKPLPDFSVGLKVVAGDFEYGSRYLETTGFTAGFQPMVHYDLPVKLFTIRGNPSYINLTASTGLLYIPVKTKNYEFTDPYTGEMTAYSTKSPLYLPFYFGFYSPGTFGLGVEAFYAKGLNGISDIWGGKLVGLSYNHSKFRINAAYEAAVPVDFKPDNLIYFFSLNFLWKLKKSEDY
jgi:hypothetical protein